MKRLLSVLLFSGTALLLSASVPQVVPTPSCYAVSAGKYQLPKHIVIGLEDSTLEPVKSYINDWLNAPVQYKTGTTGDITLGYGGKNDISGAYELGITNEGIRVNGSDYAGVINGLSSVRQLLTDPDSDGHFPLMTIKDSPNYQWRGFMLDCARHFFTVKEIERVLDIMASYKMNVFHWHLCDDQGWRAEIKKYPELTEKAAWNKLNHLDRECLNRAKTQDNDDFILPADRIRVVEGDTLYGGYYTQEDMRHIVDYAAKRAINVMPEIDVPGHATVFTTVFPDLSCDGRPSFEMCIGAERSLPIVQDIFTELMAIFPYKYIHIGGDEADKSRWENCDHCKALAKLENLESPRFLQGWFNRKMELFFRNHERIMIGWDEITYDGLGAETAVMWWRGDERGVINKATADGKGVVCSSNSILYVNGVNSNETVRRILSLDPRDKELTSSQSRLVMGLQAQLWTELVPTLSRVGYQIFPRLFAVAEAAWTPLEKRMDYNTFIKVSDREYARLDALGFNYALPDIEGFEKNNVFIDKVKLNPTCASSVAKIRYTTDGSIPTNRSRLFKEPIVIKDNTDLCVATFRENGTRSDFKYACFRKQKPLPALNVKPQNEGLKVFWHKNNEVKSCGEIPSMPVIKELTTREIRLPDEVEHDRALIFRGYVLAPATGVYDFGISSDDGSTIAIDGKIVVDNDGYHGTEHKQLQLALEKGWHEMEIRYFDYRDGSGYLEGYVNCVDNPAAKVKFAH